MPNNTDATPQSLEGLDSRVNPVGAFELVKPPKPILVSDEIEIDELALDFVHSVSDADVKQALRVILHGTYTHKQAFKSLLAHLYRLIELKEQYQISDGAIKTFYAGLQGLEGIVSVCAPGAHTKLTCAYNKLQLSANSDVIGRELCLYRLKLVEQVYVSLVSRTSIGNHIHLQNDILIIANAMGIGVPTGNEHDVYHGASAETIIQQALVTKFKESYTLFDIIERLLISIRDGMGVYGYVGYREDGYAQRYYESMRDYLSRVFQLDTTPGFHEVFLLGDECSVFDVNWTFVLKHLFDALMHRQIAADQFHYDATLAWLFFKACKKGSVDIVKILIAVGFDVNFKALNDVSSLHILALKENIDILQLLISSAAEVNAANNTGLTPLHYACKKGNDATAISLLKAGADVNAVSECGFTPLHFACEEGRDSTVLILLKYGANVNVLNAFGMSPFRIACEHLDNETINALIIAGADINQAPVNVLPPLHHAVDDGDFNLAKLLLLAGADMFKPYEGGNPYEEGPVEVVTPSEVVSAYEMAVSSDSDDIRDLFLQFRKIYAVLDKHASLLIDCIVENGYLGPKTDSYSESFSSAIKKLMIQIINQDTRFCPQKLFKYHDGDLIDIDWLYFLNIFLENLKKTQQLSEVFQLDALLTNFFVIACKKNQVSVVRSLLPLVPLTWHVFDSLKEACMQGRLELANVLLNADVDINTQGLGNENLLYLSALNNHPGIVGVLLRHKDINVFNRSSSGLTALEVAAELGHHEVISLLLFHSDTLYTHPCFSSALAKAREFGQRDAEMLLERYQQKACSRLAYQCRTEAGFFSTKQAFSAGPIDVGMSPCHVVY